MVSNFLVYLALPFISDIITFILSFRCAKALGLAHVCNRSRWNHVSFIYGQGFARKFVFVILRSSYYS